MLYINVILDPGTQAYLTSGQMTTFGTIIVPVIKRALKSKGEVLFIADRALVALSEADVILKVEYPTGYDESEGGFILYNPSAQQKKKLSDVIADKFKAFLKKQGVKSYNIHISIQPMSGCYSKTYK